MLSEGSYKFPIITFFDEMKVLLHIGYPKTASTWLQENFFPHVRNIRSFDRKSIQKYFLEPGAFDFNIDITQRYFNGDDNKITLISDELLLGRLRPGGVKGFVTKEVANRLRAVFPGAQIIIFIRHQADIVASSYVQYVRSGGNYGIKKFLYPEKYFGDKGNKLVLLGLDYFLYDKVIDYYASLFGKENVHIFIYEEFRDNSRDFLKKFSDRFGLKYNDDEINFSPVNTSYRKFLILTRRFSSLFSRNGPLNKYYLFHIPRFDYLSRYFHTVANNYRIFGNRLSFKEILGRKNLLFINEYYKESNRILIEKYDLADLRKYNYPL